MIGFVGLGAMGGPMARRLASLGHRLVVHDLYPSKEALDEAVASEATSWNPETFDQLDALLARLAREEAGPDGEVRDLRVVRPSLEDVYLDLITGERPVHTAQPPREGAASPTDLEPIR